MTQLKALIFDVDGTLAETEEAHRLAFNQTFLEMGLGWDWDRGLYGKLLSVAGGRERIFHYINDYLLPGQRTEGLPEDLNDFVSKMHADKTRHYQDMLLEGQLPFRPGVARLIEEAHEGGLKLAISTTTSRTNVEALFSHAYKSSNLDVLSWFAAVATGEMVSEKKPSPQVYQVALDGLGLPAECCVAFEDSVIGFSAASAALIPTIVTTDTYSQHGKFDNPLIVLDSLGEPDKPFNVTQGEAYGHRYVDLEMVKSLHAQAYK